MDYTSLKKMELDRAEEVVNKLNSSKDKYVKYKESRPITDIRHMMQTSAALYGDNVAFMQKFDKEKGYENITYKDVEELYYPKGCEECHNGYVNQLPIVEVIEVTDEIKNAITNKKSRKVIRELLYKNNNSIVVDGFHKVLDGVTSFNEIIRIIDVKNDFVAP